MQGWQDWVGLAGLVLSVGGLVITLAGLDSLTRELYPSRPLPHRQGWRWFVRVVLRHKPNQRVVAGVATINLQAVTGNARGLVTKARPDLDAPRELWVEYLDSQIAALGNRIDWATEDLRKADQALGEKIDVERSERLNAESHLSDTVRRWLGGEGGRGLTIAWWGIAVTIVGTVLQGFAFGLAA